MRTPEQILRDSTTVAIGARALWLQQGIASEDARDIAEAAGLDYVEDCCVAIERARGQLTKLRSGTP